MRLLVFFDLPTKLSSERKEYREFRKFLLSNGYLMIQYSVYSRFCRNFIAVKKHKQRLYENKPPEGEVRIMVVTEKQYNEIEIMNSTFTYHEKKLSTNPIVEV